MFKPLILVIGLAILGVVLAACGDDATPTPLPTSTPVPATATPVATSTPVPATAAPTSVPQATERPAAPKPPGKRGGSPAASTNADIFHWGIHECVAFDNTCLAHPAPNYNNLIEYNPETDDISDIRCDLCVDWDLSEDGTAYTFSIHPDAVWNNGTPVTATDVVFSLDRMVDPDKPHTKTRAIDAFYEGSRALDAKTVMVTTKFPAPAFFPILASQYMKILSKDHVESVPDQNMQAFEHIMGSGPFRVVSGESGIKIEYVRNEDYFKPGLPYFDAITLYIIPDTDRLAGAFKTRQVLFTIHPNSGIGNREALKLAEELEGQARYIFVGPIAPLGLYFNSKRAPFDDPRVRRALNMVVHRQPHIQTHSNGVDLLGGPFPPNAWYGIPEDELSQLPGYRETADGQKHPDDIALAKELLAAAGVEENHALEILYPFIFEHPEIAAIMQDQLQTFLGWEVTLDGADIQTYLAQRSSGQFMMSNWGYGILAHDPHDFMTGFYTEDGSGNYSGWSNPRIEEIAKLQARELDRVKRKALIDEATLIFMNVDTPVIILYHTVRGHYSDLVIQNHHPVGTLSDALLGEHFWCDPDCS